MKTPANGSSLRLSLKSGKIICKKIILEVPIEKVHRKNSRASSTSVTDRGSLFVSFLDQEQMFIAAYDFNKSPGWNSANLSGLHLSLPMENSSFVRGTPVLHRQVAKTRSPTGKLGPWTHEFKAFAKHLNRLSPSSAQVIPREAASKPSHQKKIPSGDA